MTRNFNLPPGVTQRDLDGGGYNDLDNSAADETVERAKDAWVMETAAQKERQYGSSILGTSDREQP